ncbi:hypothetical protein FACS189449_07310 [Alphaproteobacteria bacterium]|nr:hypothetical protein FACS189449_07310 [Alphaproteobacteria bacterium]
MVSKKEPCACSKIKCLATVIVSVAAGFALSHFVFPPAVPPKIPPRIENLFKTHGLFQRCKPDTRELAFLEKGGEYFADYENPRTFNDKIAYILHNYYQKSPITLHIGNKYLAKKYVAQAVGEEYVVKLLGVWDNPSDIKWDDLPNQFVLKTARGHFGKQVIVVKDKSKTDIAATIKQLEEFCKIAGMASVKSNRIIAEEYLEPSDGTKAVTDYKFFCSYGRVLFAYCLSDSDGTTCDVDTKSFSFYSVPDWKRFPITVANHEPNLIPPPKHFNRMIALAEKLSKPFPLIRIDLYDVGDRVLVGELTEDSGGAKNVLSPLIWDFKLGEMIDVPTLEELNKLIENDKKKYGEEGIGNW